MAPASSGIYRFSKGIRLYRADLLESLTEPSLTVGHLDPENCVRRIGGGHLRHTRRRVLALAKDTSDMLTAERTAKVCSILPSTDKADNEAGLALAHKAVEIGKGGDWNLLALGMAEYRSGHDAAAAEALLAAAKAGQANYFVTGAAAFYRAMSLYRLGKPDDARRVAIEAAAKMKPLPNPPVDDRYNRDDLVDGERTVAANRLRQRATRTESGEQNEIDGGPLERRWTAGAEVRPTEVVSRLRSIRRMARGPSESRWVEMT